MSWLDEFLKAVKQVQSGGLNLVQRQTINFVSGATVADDPTNNRTNVTITSLTTPTGTGFVHVTSGVVDGAATNVALATQVTGTLPLANLTKGTAGQFLVTNNSATAPAWATCTGDIAASTSTVGQMAVVAITGAGGVCPVAAVLRASADGVAMQSFDETAMVKASSGGVAAIVGNNPLTVTFQDGSDPSDTIVDVGDDGTAYIRAPNNALEVRATVGGLTLACDSASTTIQSFGSQTIVSGDNEIELFAPDVFWNAGVGSTISITQNTQAADNPARDMIIGPQGAYASAVTNVNGGAFYLRSGTSAVPGTTGRRGPVRIAFSNLIPMVEIAEPTVGRRVVALCQTSGTPGVTSTELPGTGNDGVIFIWNRAVGVSSSPVGGYILFAEGGALKGLGTSGTVTTIGPAEPHCPVCSSDFGHEWTNAAYGSLQICMSCLADHLGTKPWIRRTPGKKHGK